MISSSALDSIFITVDISKQFFPLMGRLSTPKPMFLTFILFLIMCLDESGDVYKNADTHKDQKNWILLELQVAANHLLWLLGTDLGSFAHA